MPTYNAWAAMLEIVRLIMSVPIRTGLLVVDDRIAH
jgi:hypothetical protein